MDNIDDYLCPISGCLMTSCFITKCGHKFHRDALLVWLMERNTCPVDRSEIWIQEVTRGDEISNVAKNLALKPEHADLIYKWGPEERKGKDERTAIKKRLIVEKTNALFIQLQATYPNGAPGSDLDFFKELRIVLKTIDGITEEDILNTSNLILQTVELEQNKHAAPLINIDDSDNISMDEMPSHSKGVKFIDFYNTTAYLVMIGWDFDSIQRMFVKYNKFTIVTCPNLTISWRRCNDVIGTHRDKLVIDGKDTVPCYYNDVVQFVWIRRIENGDVEVACRDMGHPLDYICCFTLDLETQLWVERK